MKRIPPENYTGPVDPQHAAEILARARRSPPGIRLNDADRAHATALQSLAIGMQDAALGKLALAIHETNHDQDTLVIVTSDVGLPDKGFVSDGDALEETTLAIPLVMRGPGIAEKSRFDTPTTSSDIARTILAGLGLEPPATFGGADIRLLGSEPRPLLASIGDRWSLRLLGFVLHQEGRGADLCDLMVDPTCAADAEAQAPIAMEIVRRTDVGTLRKVEPSYPSTATINALRTWGR
jgi:hypothetical protein